MYSQHTEIIGGYTDDSKILKTDKINWEICINWKITEKIILTKKWQKNFEKH